MIEMLQLNVLFPSLGQECCFLGSKGCIGLPAMIHQGRPPRPSDRNRTRVEHGAESLERPAAPLAHVSCKQPPADSPRLSFASDSRPQRALKTKYISGELNHRAGLLIQNAKLLVLEIPLCPCAPRRQGPTQLHGKDCQTPSPQ